MDLSLLAKNTKINANREDYIKIDRKDPFIYGELKEKIMYEYNISSVGQENALRGVKSKGYIGIVIKQDNQINNKDFYLNFIKETWKDLSLFKDRDINNKIEKITEMIYKIKLNRASGSVKLITYAINQAPLMKFRFIEMKLQFMGGELNIEFNYKNEEKRKNIYKTRVLLYNNSDKLGAVNITSNGALTGKNSKCAEISYDSSINQSKIKISEDNIKDFIDKIIVRIEIRDFILSGNDVEIKYNNSLQDIQEKLPMNKLLLLSYEYN